MTTTIGLCGLGQMGLAVAGRLAARFPVVAFDPSAERRALADRIDDITTVDTLDGLAGLTVVVLSLPTPAISLGTCEALAGLLPADAVVIETSTTTPDAIQSCQKSLAARGLAIVDAAILSGVGQMQSGSATLLLGGETSVIERMADILTAIAPHSEYFGELGSGMAAKVINNGVAHAVMVVLAEAASLAAATGVDLDQLTRMLAAPDGGLMRPLTYRLAERVAHRDYEGGMPLDAARKDSTLALSLAQQHGVPLFAMQGAHTVYEIAMNSGLARKDYAALVTLWETWTGRELQFAPEQPQ
jgi:3-hydroxyisobutyrate dehydrogenase-like beta-hydroxyacid dehydrogenase